MLSYPDRQTFEELRARWETAPASEEDTSSMVGRREKSALPQSVTGETQSSGGSKFRRKLSHGLAFMANPLSQRKTTPARSQLQPPPVAVSEPVTTDEPAAPDAHDAPLSFRRNSTTSELGDCSPSKATVPVNNQTPTESVDRDSTPTLIPLPRARTLSFIPRPARSESGLFATGVEGSVKTESLAVKPDTKSRVMSSKIPTPSPPLSERHCYSPRQHIPHHASQHAMQTAGVPTFVAENRGSPVEFAVRSQTTPNLVKSFTSPRPTQSRNFVASNQAGLKKPTTSPRTPRPVLQENVPTSRQTTQRLSQAQEKTLRRESLAVPGSNSSRRSFGPGRPTDQSKQPVFATPPSARKRLSTQSVHQQTPVTAKRVSSKVQVNTRFGEQSQVGNGGAIAQPRLMRPRSPPGAPVGYFKPQIPRLSTEKDLQRQTLGTPNGLGGVWRSSRALGMTNHEVRRLPRSSTFHDFGVQREPIPPVPPIPEQYKTPSLSNLTQHARMNPDTPVRPRHSRMVSNATSCESIPEETNGDDGHGNVESTASQVTPRQPPKLEYSSSTDSLTATPQPTPNVSEIDPARSQNQRPWSISEKQSEDDADIARFLQVKDYMPPLYWAGRFQARFDQWRTEAMMAQLNPSHQPSGPLGEYKLDDEKRAACYIFAQLRDLCTSNQAADSLWVRNRVFCIAISQPY